MNSLNINIPIVAGDNFDVSGYFFTLQRNSQYVGLFQKENKKIKPITGSYKAEPGNEFLFTSFFLEEYLEELKLFLDSLLLINGEKYFSSTQINEIVYMERQNDPRRGELSPYVRMLIASFLKSFGVYVNNFMYLGHQGKRHCFLIKSFFMKKENKFLSINKNFNGRINIRHRLQKSLDNLVFRNTNSVFSELAEVEQIFFQASLRSFFQDLSPREQERKRKWLRFLGEPFENKK